MSTQTEAERLADELEYDHNMSYPSASMWKAAAELRRLSAIEEAAKNLVKVKGRYHTEQAFNTLKELLK